MKIVQSRDQGIRHYFSYFSSRCAFIICRCPKVWRWIVAALLVLALFAGSNLASFYYGAVSYRTSAVSFYRFNLYNLLASNFKIVSSLRSLFVSPPTMNINIKHLDLEKLEYLRAKAIAKGEISYAMQKVSVKAKLDFQGQSIPAEISLSGQSLDHAITEKWSMRVKLKNDRSNILGMIEFDLYHPVARQGIFEWLGHRLQRKEGLIELPYDFMEVKVNGINKGIYIVESTFNKTVIEKNKLREGIIFRPMDDLRIKKPKKVAESPTLTANLQMLRTMFRAFLNGEIPTSKIFDVKKMARFYALVDLLNADHMLNRSNTYYYFNPVTALIEPIGREYESVPYHPLESIVGEFHGKYLNNKYNQILFRDLEFYKQYISELVRISNDGYVTQFWDEIEDELQDKMDVLHRSYPHYTVSPDFLRANQSYIRSVLKPVEVLRSNLVRQDGKQIVISVENIQPLPVEILSLSLSNGKTVAVNSSKVVLGKTVNDPVRPEQISFIHPSSAAFDAKQTNFSLNYRILGTSELRSYKILTQRDVTPPPYLAPNIEDKPFLIRDPSAKVISFKAGAWNIDQTLVVPEGYRLVVLPGTQLNLIKGASLFSRSPLEIAGTEKNQIRIISKDHTGSIVVLNTGSNRSLFENVIFEGLGAPVAYGWKLSGGVTFYESNATIRSCVFKDNKSKDALSVIRSEIDLEKSVFTSIKGDAFDADFSRGSISYTSFNGMSNDGIDLSGSVFKLSNLQIDGAADKGISAGEQSDVTGSEIEIRKSKIGIASKNKSTVNIADLKLENLKWGIVAYQNKPEFGSAQLQLSDVSFNKVEHNYFIENDCRLFIDNHLIAGQTKNVFKKLYKAKSK